MNSATSRRFGTVLLLLITLAGCRSIDNPKASLRAKQRVESEFSSAAPLWTTSRNCDTSSPDFYTCQYWVSVSEYRSNFPRGAGGQPPPPPHLFKTFTATSQSVANVQDGNYLVKVAVSGVCAFSDLGSMFGRPCGCGGADQQYHSIFNVTVGADWNILSIQEDTEVVRRRDEAQRQAEIAREAARRRLQATADLENAINNSNLEAVRQDLQDGADPNAYFGKAGEYPLMLAKTPEIMDLLIKAGADVDGKGQLPPCPICLAAYDNHVDLFEVLYKAGANTALPVMGVLVYRSAEQSLGDCRAKFRRDDVACSKMQEIMRHGR